MLVRRWVREEGTKDGLKGSGLKGSVTKANYSHWDLAFTAGPTRAWTTSACTRPLFRPPLHCWVSALPGLDLPTNAKEGRMQLHTAASTDFTLDQPMLERFVYQRGCLMFLDRYQLLARPN